jgi:hypothetical protein
MLRQATRALCCFLMLAAPMFALSGAARAADRIAPQQRFTGLVNGHHQDAKVYVACPGPVWPGRTTHPLQNQTLAVARAASGDGFTGEAATRVVARFVDDASVGVVLTTYGSAQPVPTSISVPCEGKSVVRFAPRPRSSPSVPDSVPITFVNLAV